MAVEALGFPQDLFPWSILDQESLREISSSNYAAFLLPLALGASL